MIPVEAQDAALRIILVRCPGLAEKALALRARRAGNARAKAVAALSTEALTSGVDLEPAERKALAAASLPDVPPTKTQTLGPVRVTVAEYLKVKQAADDAGLKLATYLRRKLLE